MITGAEMTEATKAPQGQAPGELGGKPVAPAAKGRRRWLLWAVPVVALIVGGAIGAGILSAVTDPTRSDQYRSLAAQLSEEQQHVDNWRVQAEAAASSARAAQSSAEVAQSSASQAAAAAAQRQAELDQREAQVAGREAAVSSTEQRIAASSIGEGTWTVGRDVVPGTYRTKEAVTGMCYWEISRTGSNGSFNGLITNDVVTGGFPTVTLRQGQDFKNQGCGTFVKQ